MLPTSEVLRSSNRGLLGLPSTSSSETQRCTCIELKVEVLQCRQSYPGSAAAACTKPPQQVIKTGREWQTASETSLEKRKKLDDSEICSSKRKTRRRGSSWARSRHRWSFWWSGGERRHPRAQESETRYHAAGEKEDQGRHCWSAVENHSQDWKTCTTNQQIPSEGHASVQGWWIPALISSRFPCALQA